MGCAQITRRQVGTETEEDAYDVLEAMLTQERSYHCRNYIDNEVSQSSSNETCLLAENDLVRLLEEFANVVTDRTFLDAPKPRTYRYLNAEIPFTRTRSFSFSSESISSMRDVRDVDQAASCAASSSSKLLQRRRIGHQTSSKSQQFASWRKQMFEWVCMVVDSFQMDRELVAVTFNLLDRYMAKELENSPNEPVLREDFQLFTMTCLYLTIKISQPYPKKMGIEALVEMSRGFYSHEDIASTERDILKALGWYLHPPTALGFAQRLWKMFPATDKKKACRTGMRATSVELTELAISNTGFISNKRSSIGLACVLHAARMGGAPDASIRQFLDDVQEIIPYETAEFRSVYARLENLSRG